MARRELHRLKARSIENMKKPGRYADGGGLYLQVGPTGTKSWLFRFMREGRAREMGLGPLHTVPLASQTQAGPNGTKREIRGARDLAADARRLLLEGMDPIAERENRRETGRRAAGSSKTFAQCAEAYIKAHRPGWRNTKHAAQWESTLATYVYPELGEVPVGAIDTPAVLKVLEPIWSTKPETASRLRGRVECVLDWATVRGFREGLNPARWRGHLDHTLPKRSHIAKTQHHAALSFTQLPAFMKALQLEEGLPARALEFLILTAARTAEVIGATWDEIDLDTGIWTIPAARMKGGRIHKVPLTERAVRVLKQARVAGEDHVFAGRQSGKGLSNMALLKTLERMGKSDVTVHGFRSTFRDWASESTTFSREVIEMALAHAIGDKVEAAYRRGDLFEKRRKLMEAWSAYARTPREGVVNMHGRRAPAVA
jgi:integrase